MITGKQQYPVVFSSVFGHFKIAKIIAEFPNVQTILDVGGTGKLRHFGTWEVLEANKNKGLDGCRLPYPDDHFDIVVSVSTVEHVANPDAFFSESLRVSRLATIHTFCAGDLARKTEVLKADMGHAHPCVVPDVPKETEKRKVLPFFTVWDHLLCLAALYPKKFNNLETMQFWDRNKGVYSYMVIEEK
jgi:SAM-dependent methyltransferase